MSEGLRAIVDIGSNSIRLVVYAPPLRAPAVVFNEKVMAGLGSGLAETGRLDAAAIGKAVAALKRFALLIEAMGCDAVRAVATAAVRDAANGAEFLAAAAESGLSIEVLSGEAEAEGAGYGVLSAIPDADGIVGDLGGGSLELVRVGDGMVQDRLSLPLGVLRLSALRSKRGRLEQTVGKSVRKAEWLQAVRDKPFYMVGGSWRALARVHMDLTDHPLRVLHNYVMPPLAAPRLVRALGRLSRKRLRAVGGLPQGRVAALGDAAALLGALVRHLQPSALVVSASGLREGLLFQALDSRRRREDPLLLAVREAAKRQVRFDQHGDLLAEWIAPLFPDDPPAMVRLRDAACLLGDVAWAANPDFRAERAVEIALHGNWVGIDSVGRVILAQALHMSFGGTAVLPVAAALAPPDALQRASQWGLAMRLGQRLSGGVAGPLRTTSLSAERGAVHLRFAQGQRDLYGEPVERRQRQLATALGLDIAIS